MFKLYFKFSLFLSALMLLSACSTPTANLKIDAVSYLNPNVYGQASPVVITLYQLKNDYAFQQSDYNTLMLNSSSVLGEDLIDKNAFEIRPNGHLQVKQNLYPNTQYLGIVAGYRHPAGGGWYKVVKLKKPGKAIKLHINLESNEFIVSQD